MLSTLSLLTSLTLTFAQDDMDVPDGFAALCGGMENIIKWENVPHDWRYDKERREQEGQAYLNECCDSFTDAEKMFPTIPNCCEGNGVTANSGKRMYANKDWWYWYSDWKQVIADGDLTSEALDNDGTTMGICAESQWGGKRLGDLIIYTDDVETVEDRCRKACAFKYTTEEDTRLRCTYFSFSEEEKSCLLFSGCGWDFNTATTWTIPAENGVTYSAANMKTHRVINIYPAGFKPFDLREFNEPPVCIWVPDSGDKKVEVMIETEMNDAAVCIRDGSDLGIGRNAAVGNVETCNDGKLEACFTAASDRDENKDFFFMIYCEGSCEATDIDLWLRIRTSRVGWDYGKTSTQDDIEMWCEMEKGSTSTYVNRKGQTIEMDDYTWPSALLPRKPDKDPFNIQHRYRSGAIGVQTSWVVALVSVAAVFLGM